MHNPITQQQAEQLLENTTPEPWYLPAGHSVEDEKLAISSPNLARTVVWLWEQNQQQQAKIGRLQAYARSLENSFDETAFIRDNTHLKPGDME